MIKKDPTLLLLQNIHKTVRCGLHSGFPPCCVAFYITRLLSFTVEDEQAYRKVHDVSWGYVPCPDCIEKKNRVKVKRCPIGCGSHEHEVFLKMGNIDRTIRSRC